MFYLRQSTAATLKVGPVTTDGATPTTGASITQADVRLSKNGGDFAQKSETSSATHDENGWYDLSVDTTDTNTAGRLLLAVYESGELLFWHEYTILPQSVYDLLFSGISEPTGVPAWPMDLGEILGWIAFLNRNKIEQTSTKTTLYDDAGTSAIAESSVSNDGTTFTRGEWADPV